MAKVTADKLGRFRPQTRNSNRHTQRGMGQLEASMRKYGYVTPMTAAADGEIIDGSARAETGATVFGDDVLVVHHDGTKPVIMVRDDIPSADTPEAREISIAANRIAQVNLDFDPEVLLGDLQAGVDLSQFWRQDELGALLAGLSVIGLDDAGDAGARETNNMSIIGKGENVGFQFGDIMVVLPRLLHDRMWDVVNSEQYTDRQAGVLAILEGGLAALSVD